MSELEERDDRERHFMDSQHILYAIFRHRKDYHLEDVAERIGVPYDTLKKYVVGRMACPVEVLKKIYLATRHPLLKELLEPEGYELVPKGKCKLSLLPSVDAHVVQALGRIVDLQRSFEKYFEDKHLSAQEFQDLKVLRGETQDAINVLWHKIASMVEKNRGDA